MKKIRLSVFSKTNLLTTVFVLFVGILSAQNVAINDGGLPPDSSAMLDIASQDKGLLIPRLRSAQRLNIVNPANGLLVFQVDPPRGFYAYFTTPGVWTRITMDSTLSLSNVLAVGNDASSQSIVNLSRLGIGTTTPIDPLQIGSFSTLSNQFMSIRTAGGNNYRSGINLKHFNDGNGFSLVSDESDNMFYIYRHNGDTAVALSIDRINDNVGIKTSTALVGFSIGPIDDNTGFENSADGVLSLITNGVERARFTNQGRVGIGTSLPSRKLQVHESAGTSSFGQFTTSNTGSSLNDGTILGYADGVGAVLFNAENSNMAFATASIYRMWLDPNGNLGIGTASPSARLHLSGNSTVTELIESSSTLGTWLALRNSSIGGKYHQIISTGSANGEGPGKLLFGYGASAGTVTNITMTIDDRMVGIGTSNPSSDIEILQYDATIGGPGGLRNRWGASYWRLFHSGLHYSFENDGVRYAYVESGTGNYIQPSDKNLKENIQLLSPVLDRISKLRPVNYNYIRSAEKEPITTYGFIAQEVLEAFPSLVHYGENGELGLAYSEFGVIAIKAIQEQEEKIEELETRIKQLEDLINEIQKDK